MEDKDLFSKIPFNRTEEELLHIIENRIRSEHRKYLNSENIDWAKMSASKIIRTLKELNDEN